MWLTPNPAYRSRVVSYAQYCSNLHYKEWDPNTLCVTEGRRDVGAARYSWCGDQVTYVLMSAGVTSNAQFLNRKQLNGEWRVGQNISLLIEAGKQYGEAGFVAGSRAWNRLKEPGSVGDIVVIDVPNGGHVGILASYDGGDNYSTYDGNTFFNGVQGTVAKRNRNRTVQNNNVVCLIRADVWGQNLSQPTLAPSASSDAPGRWPLLDTLSGGPEWSPSPSELAKVAISSFDTP